MDKAQIEAGVWHPDLQTSYRKKLCFVSITTEVYNEQFKRQLGADFSYLNIYEVYGKADLFLRLYSDDYALNALQNYLSRELHVWGYAYYYFVTKIYRIWGHDVSNLAPSLRTLDPETLNRIAATWPDVSDRDKMYRGVILGKPKLTAESNIRAFIAVKLQHLIPKELQDFIQKIRREEILDRHIYGIYEVAPGSGVEGNLFLEVAVPNYPDVRAALQKLYNLAFPPEIKTTTFLVSDMSEVGDVTDFKETPDIVLQSYLRKFPELNAVPTERLFAKIDSIKPLKSWWNSPAPIGKWVERISNAIIEAENEQELKQSLIGPVNEITLPLENHLKGLLIPWAREEYGTADKEEWKQKSTNDLKLSVPLTDAPFGALVFAAREVEKKRVTLAWPAKLSLLEQFNLIRVSVTHAKDPGDPRRLHFEELQKETPNVLAQLFTEAAPFFVKERFAK